MGARGSRAIGLSRPKRSWRRRLYLSIARAVVPYTSTIAEGAIYLVATNDGGPGRALFVRRTATVFDALARALELLSAHGETYDAKQLIDVGANIGTTAIPALTRYGFSRVVAIEPDPDNARVLRANAALNGLEDALDVIEAAASAEAGRGVFQSGKQTKHGRRAGAGRLLREAAAEEAEQFGVDVVTLDEVMGARGIAPEDVGLLWVDVQGNEGQVLEGASQLVNGSRPVVFAARHRKLRRSGALDPLISIVTGHYAWIADLRAAPREGEYAPRARPAQEIGRLLESTQTTNVIAFGVRS